MKFEIGKMYRITELDTGLVIGPADVVIPTRNAQPLIIAHTDQLMEYLSRYLWEREKNGASLKQAHELALAYVGVTHTIPKETVAANLNGS